MPRRDHNLKLTKRTVEALEAAETDYIRFDTDMPRFGVRVLPSGHKSYLVQYRKGGRTRRVRLGRHGDITCDQARRMAQELLGRVARGENPAEEITTHRRAPTVATLCDRFMAEHVAHRCKPTTQGEYRRSVDLFIKPRLGSFKLPDLKRADIAQLHHELRHIPYQANRTLGVLSRMFNLAELWGLLPDGSGLCRHIRKYPERRRERFLSEEEYDRLLNTLDELEQERPDMLPAINAIRLLMFTGARLSEIQTLKWDYVTDEGLALPDAKAGALLVPLGEHARNVLRSIERLPENPYLITGQRPGQHLTDLQRPWRRIRARAGLGGVRIHDLRHSFAAMAVRAGVNPMVLRDILGHRQIQTTSRYAHVARDVLLAATTQVTGSIAGARRSP